MIRLRGFDPGGSVYRYADDDLLCMAYGKNGSDARMAALAALTDDLIYLTRFS